MRRREPKESSGNWINDARRRLADWRGKKPETKAGQIWALWPEIKAALADGQSIKSVRQWLEQEAGVVVTADSLRSYLRRCRGKDSSKQRNMGGDYDAANALENAPGGKFSPVRTLHLRPLETVRPADAADDPMASARKALSKPRFDIRKIHGDGDPSDRNLI